LSAQDTAARRVLVVAYDDAQILDVACSSATFEIANEYMKQRVAGF
jgi:hypothetical protein